METNAIASTAGSDTKSALQLLHDARAKKVAQEFESIFTSMMLKSMRGTVQTGDDDFMPASFGQKVYTDMLDDEYGKIMADHSSIGIAGLILKQIQKQDNGAVSPLAMLTELKMQPWLLDNKFVPRPQAASAGTGAVRGVSQWNAFIDQASATYNLDPSLISAVMARESGGNAGAVSAKGAKGLMQLMDSTATDLGVGNVYNPSENIMAGAKYLRQMLDQFDGDETLALAAYNAGPAAVQQYNGVPPYPETRNYVNSVLAMKDSFIQTGNTPNKEVTNGSAGK
jgi:Rod binding domain-containing protein